MAAVHHLPLADVAAADPALDNLLGLQSWHLGRSVTGNSLFMWLTAMRSLSQQISSLLVQETAARACHEAPLAHCFNLLRVYKCNVHSGAIGVGRAGALGAGTSPERQPGRRVLTAASSSRDSVTQHACPSRTPSRSAG
jgi:hypothetical protein